MNITQSRLMELLDYDSHTGLFTRRVSRRSDRVGKQPGAKNTKGYIQIRLDGRLFVAHRLAWLYVYGKEPEYQVDHINGDKADNRIANLRSATNKQNQENMKLQRNNTTGYRGVSFDSDYGMYRSYVCHNYQTFLIGFFKTVEEAAGAAKAKRDELFTHNKTEYSS